MSRVAIRLHFERNGQMKSFYIGIEIRNNNKIKPITVYELPMIARSRNDIIETHLETVLMYIGIIITSTFSTTCLPKEHTLVEQLIDICSSLSYLNQSRKHITYEHMYMSTFTKLTSHQTS